MDSHAKMVADGLTKVDSLFTSRIEGFMATEEVRLPRNTLTKEISNMSAWL